MPQVGELPAKQPAPVFTHNGGDVWFELSPIAWTRDGSRYAFSTWEREKELLRVYMGTADENAKPDVVLERRGDIGHEVVNVLRPQFTPDGKLLVLQLDEAGHRQPYGLDVATRALRPLLKGDPGLETPAWRHGAKGGDWGLHAQTGGAALRPAF